MKKRLLKVILIIFSLTVILLGYYEINKVYHIGIPCLFYKITNYKCPGCGITRALFSLIRGNIKEAIYYNKILILMVPFIVIYFGYKSYLYIINIRSNKKIERILNIWAYILLIIAILYGVFRNM